MNWFLKLAARKTFWHGTSGKNLRTILKNGLIGNLPDSDRHYPSNESAGSLDGVYLADHPIDAFEHGFNYEWHTLKKDESGELVDILLIEISGEEKSMVLDEDHLDRFSSYLDKIKSKLNIAPGEELNHPELAFEAATDFANTFGEHPKNIESLVPIIQRIMQLMIDYGISTEDNHSVLLNIPQARGLFDKLIQQFYFGGIETYRYPKNIGFSGSNRIITIIRFLMKFTENRDDRSINAEVIYQTPFSSDINSVIQQVNDIYTKYD